MMKELFFSGKKIEKTLNEITWINEYFSRKLVFTHV